MGTMIQRHDLTEEDFRAERFAEHPCDLKGNNDLLSLTQPEIIRGIHEQYLEAGADILETNTFSAQRVSMADYQMEGLSRELNVASARIARQAADAYTQRDPSRPRFVAGAMGPTNRTLSISPDVTDRPSETRRSMSSRTPTPSRFAGWSTAASISFWSRRSSTPSTPRRRSIDVMRSSRRGDRRGRSSWSRSPSPTPRGARCPGRRSRRSGSPSSHAEPLGGGHQLRAGRQGDAALYEGNLNRISRRRAYLLPIRTPGCPTSSASTTRRPRLMAGFLRRVRRGGLAQRGRRLLRHDARAHRHREAAVARMQPRRADRPSAQPHTRYCAGLEPLTIRPDANFVNVGERTNVTGSRAFKRLIKNGDYETALEVARRPGRGRRPSSTSTWTRGCSTAEDDGDVPESHRDRARHLARADHDRQLAFEVIEAGLQVRAGQGDRQLDQPQGGRGAVQGPGARGPALWGGGGGHGLRREGQATVDQRKVAICERAYRILVDEVGFEPGDIIFDPNILTVATGIEEHNDYAIHFIEAVREIKARMPRVKTIGGVSNISFSFRGNNPVREAMHAVVPLPRHRGGPGHGHRQRRAARPSTTTIDPNCCEHVEDVLFNRRPTPPSARLELAERFQGTSAGEKRRMRRLAREPVGERLSTRWCTASSSTWRGRRGGAAERPGRSMSSRGR